MIMNMNIHNIHIVGVHAMNFCSYIVGAVRGTVKSSSYIVVPDVTRQIRCRCKVGYTYRITRLVS